MINQSIPVDFVNLRQCVIDIHDIENAVRDFYLTIDLENSEDIKNQCLDARNYLDTARILIMNLIEPDHNEYIKLFKKNYYWLLDNSGRINLSIDELEESTIEKLEVLELSRKKEFPNSPKIRKYINHLIKLMEHQVYFPLKNALTKFNECEDIDENGNQRIKDTDLYCFYLFQQLYNASESLGSISGEKVKVVPKQQVISSRKASHEDPDQTIEDLPEHPESIRLKSEDEEFQEEEEDPSLDKIIQTEQDIFGKENEEFEAEEEQDEEDD